jgi:hypothetical protein
MATRLLLAIPAVLAGALASSAEADEVSGDPFLPGLEQRAPIEMVRDAMEAAGWMIDICVVHPDDSRSLFAVNEEGWHLRYEYGPDDSPLSAMLVEEWGDAPDRAASYEAWKKKLTALYGEPKPEPSAYADYYNEKLLWTCGSTTLELYLDDLDFSEEGGVLNLAVLVCFD